MSNRKLKLSLDLFPNIHNEKSTFLVHNVIDIFICICYLKIIYNFSTSYGMVLNNI